MLPKLKQSLLHQDKKQLEIIASLWSVKPDETSLIYTAEDLSSVISDSKKLMEMLQNSPQGVVDCIAYLIRHGGQSDPAVFEKNYGSIRVMGLERMEKEKPWLSPSSSTEWLYYRGIIFHEVLNQKERLKETWFIPEDLIPYLKNLYPPGVVQADASERQFISRPASPEEVDKIIPSGDSILELVCLILAAIRCGKPVNALYPVFGEEQTKFAEILLNSAGILSASNEADPEKARSHLQHSRFAALLELCITWRKTDLIDEMQTIPDLIPDRQAVYSIQKARGEIVKALLQLSAGVWWSLSGFIASMEKERTDFLHEQGLPDTWLFRNTGKDPFFNNSSQWFQIEGALIRYILLGPFVWLGIVDCALEKNHGDEHIGAFRITSAGSVLLREMLLDELTDEYLNQKNNEGDIPSISIDGKIVTGKAVPRLLRYQIARFCEWEKIEKDRFTFRVSPKSLEEAKKNGLTADAFIGMLKRSNRRELPLKLIQAIKNWDTGHVQASIYHASILTVQDPKTIDRLLENRDTSRWILQRLNPTTVVVTLKGEYAVRRGLAEQEILTDMDGES